MGFDVIHKRSSNIHLAISYFLIFILIFAAVEEESDYRIRMPTVIEVLLAIPGINMKRKRSTKKLSTAAQLEQTKEGCIDLETPDSILAQTNLRDLLNDHALTSLPQLYQQKLIQLLPSVDRVSINTPSESICK